ncbi:MAG: hypothetical protein KBD60_02240 [Sterolibacterium sp.]|jgi:hypothetical protein|nr:hypothetical protein [Sterolibacterium sp.]
MKILHTAFIHALSIGLLTSLTSLPAQASEPIAMTTDVQGKAWIVVGDQQTPLGVMAYLPSGAKLRLDKGARVAVTYFAQPREYTLNGPLQASVEANQPRSESGGNSNIIRRSLDPAQNTATQQYSARQRDHQALATFEMKALGTLQLRQPADTKLIDRPAAFTWQALASAKRYTFTLRDAEGVTLYQGESTTPQMLLPARIKLTAGQNYRWTVEAVDPGGERQSASTEFSLLDSTTRKSLEQRKPGANASFSDRLIYATMLDNAGATQEANVYWKTLAKERPQDETLQQLGAR